MAKLICVANVSLDGSVEDPHGRFDWTDPTLAVQSELMAAFAHVWQAADKIVFSATLHALSTRYVGSTESASRFLAPPLPGTYRHRDPPLTSPHLGLS